MEFKSSKLFNRLIEEGNLSQNALDFMDACTDDWQTDTIGVYSADGKDCEYEIRFCRDGWHHDDQARLTSVHSGDFTAMCALIEYEAECNTISMDYNRQRWQLEEVVNYLCEVIGDEEEAKQTLLRIAFVEDDLKEMGVIE